MEEWKDVKLGEVAEFKTGKLNSNAADINGKYPFFTCSPNVFRINSYAFDQKAILLAGNNAEGNFNIKYYEGKFNAYQRTYVISPKSEDLNIKYLFYVLKIRLQEFKQLSQGTSTRFITAKILSVFSISIPSLHVQKRIVAILSSFDDKIELNRRINANLEAQAQALFKSWFIDFEPFKDGKFVDSELGMIPEGWKVGTLLDVAQLYDSKRKPLSSMQRSKMNKIYPYYGATSIMDYVDDYIFDGIYLLMGEDGSVMDENGYPYLQYVFGQFWPNNHAHVMQGKNGYSTEMLLCLLKRTNITSLVTGAVQAKLNQTNMGKLLVIIPPIEISATLASIFDKIYAQVRNNLQESARLSAIRDTLLPKLMSGEIEI